jgi:hypothetical protein
MTITPTMFIRATLCGILMCGTSALTADVEVSTHPAERQQLPQAGVAGNSRIIRLLPEQLDTVTAGQTYLCSNSPSGTQCTQINPGLVPCPAGTLTLNLVVRLCAVTG